MRKRFSERAEYCQNSVVKKLFELIESKQSNLSVAADLVRAQEILELAKQVGPYICLLKTHVDIINDFSLDFIKELQQIAKEHRFMIFEDRKFADIGNTVKHQFSHGIYHIANWADIINAHIIPGYGIIEGLQAASEASGRPHALLLLAEMSSKGNFAQGEYTRANVVLAEKYPEFVAGFISQHRLSNNPGFVHMTPGVNLADTGDLLGQQYVSPDQAIIDHGSDVIIVGRGIYGAKHPGDAAKRYQEAGWQALISDLPNE